MQQRATNQTLHPLRDSRSLPSPLHFSLKKTANPSDAAVNTRFFAGIPLLCGDARTKRDRFETGNVPKWRIDVCDLSTIPCVLTDGCTEAQGVMTHEAQRVITVRYNRVQRKNKVQKD